MWRRASEPPIRGMDRSSRTAATGPACSSSRSGADTRRPRARPDIPAARACADDVTDAFLVFGHQHGAMATPAGAGDPARRRAGTPATGGNSTRNVVPSRGAVRMRMCPPWLSTMPITAARPRPRPVYLVEKNGSKIRWSVLLSMPQPVSVTSRYTSQPGRSPAAPSSSRPVRSVILPGRVAQRVGRVGDEVHHHLAHLGGVGGDAGDGGVEVPARARPASRWRCAAGSPISRTSLDRSRWRVSTAPRPE